MQKKCPGCGSQNVKSETIERSIGVPHGSVIKYSAINDCCLDCKGEGDFNAENDEEIEKAIQKSKAASIKFMIQKLSEKSIYKAYFERVLRLPQGILSQWEEGNFSDEAFALIWIILTFPWILVEMDFHFLRSNDLVTRHPRIVDRTKRK